LSKISYNQSARLTPLCSRDVLLTFILSIKLSTYFFKGTKYTLESHHSFVSFPHLQLLSLTHDITMSQLGGMGATPARRSARISQAGSVTNQSVVTTMTTSGTRQRKKGPLTKVKARKSNAYGASGRVGAAEELSLNATGFAQAFQNQRGDAVARDDEDEDDDIDELAAETPRMSGGLNGHASHRSPSFSSEAPTPVAPGLSFMDSEDIAPSENDLAASIGNTSKSFGPIHEAGMLFRPMRPESPRSLSEEVSAQPLWQKNRARRLQTQVSKTVEKQSGIEVQVTHEQRLEQTTPVKNGSLHKSIDDLVAVEQARLQREGPPLPRSKLRQQAPNQRLGNPQIVDDWLGNVEQGREEEPEWPWKKYAMRAFWILCGAMLALQLLGFIFSDQYSESAPRPGMVAAVNARISSAWYNTADWIMPTKRSDDRVGDMSDTIAELSGHLPENMVVRRLPNGKLEINEDFWNALSNKFMSGGDEIWSDFIMNNQEKLRDVLGVHVDSNQSDAIPEAVSRREFLTLVQEHYKKISTKVDEKVFQAIQGQASQIKAIAQAEAKKAMIDSIRLHTLAQSNLLANYELNLRRPNYFSLGHGAIIDPTLTSATYVVNPSRWARIARRLAYSPERSPPSAALDRWDEPGDCWCAAPNPDNKGQAQLTVSVSRPVFPQQVTIEHLPMSMMPDKEITNAPRNVELWVETNQRAQYQFAHREGACLEGPNGWTCLGSFAYNIHASNHQQTFDLDAQSSVPVTKAMLRVTSNWGANHTCLYRVRLHGRDPAADHEYKVHLNSPVQ
jgi:SUN domain-containing protein 1/2